jgi:hypothetical protein
MRILQMIEEAQDLVGRTNDLRTRRRALDTLTKMKRAPEQLYFAALNVTTAKARLALAMGCERELVRLEKGDVA